MLRRHHALGELLADCAEFVLGVLPRHNHRRGWLVFDAGQAHWNNA